MKIESGKRSLWLNYHHLYYFLTVASEGSISVAAQRLNVGQPALSIQLKQLEESLGIKLFERSHKKLTLTEHGKAALEYAREIFKLGGEMIETLYDLPTMDRVHLQIGALDSIAKNFTALLAEKALATKRCTLTIVEGKGDELLRELSQHRLDLVMTNKAPSSLQGQLYKRRIAKLPIKVYGSKAYLPARRKFPNSLQGLPFLLPTEESQLRSGIEDFCRLHRLRPDFLAETQDMMMQKLLACKGLGVIAAPRVAIDEFRKSQELFEIGTLDGVYEEIFLVTSSRKIENPIAVDLMKTFTLRN